jgi:hypothetical protein
VSNGTEYRRPLTRLERMSVEPAQLAKTLNEAVRRLAYVEPCNVDDVRSTLQLIAGRVARLADET